MRKPWLFAARILGPLLGVFGLAGIPDGCRTWATWIEKLDVMLDAHETLRFLIATVAVGCLWAALELHYRKQGFVRETPPPLPPPAPTETEIQEKGGDVNIVAATIRAGDGGLHDPGGNIEIRGGDAGRRIDASDFGHSDKVAIKELVAQALKIEGTDATGFPGIMADEARRWTFKVKSTFIGDKKITQLADRVIDKMPHTEWGRPAAFTVSDVRKIMRSLRVELERRL
ncbi:MAG TPA: hypothetical protein VJZ71_17745 [Phycisphaerae bacterium]|nr:hypothetical protein [Phycisphaerae bacterium]